MSINSVAYSNQGINSYSSANSASFGDNSQDMTQPRSSGGGGKLLLGTSLVGLAALGVYLVKKHTFKPIDFKPAKNVNEAKSFATNKLGVKMQKEDIPLDVANFINKGLCYLRNQTRNKFKMKFVTYSKMESEGIKDFNTMASIVENSELGCCGLAFNKSFFEEINTHIKRELQIVRGYRGSNPVDLLKIENGNFVLSEQCPHFDISNEVLALANKFRHSRNKMTLEEKFSLYDGLTNMKDALNGLAERGELGTVPAEALKIKRNPFHSLFALNGGLEFREKVGMEKINQMLPIENTNGLSADTNAFVDFMTNDVAIARKVSEKAAKSPYHFVTETYARMLNGEKFDKEIMDVYSKFEGPAVNV